MSRFFRKLLEIQKKGAVGKWIVPNRDFVHSFNHKHPGISEIVFEAISVFKQKCIILCVKSIDSVQQTGKMIVKTAPPNERIPND